MKYRREIDGLRAVAVLPVILFHAGISAFGGGFVGVDVFFVISGFLITTIIVSEFEKGSFSVARFYERRLRRIIPALFVVLAVCVPAAYILMSPSELKDFSQSLVSVPLFGSNVFFWLKSDYFGPNAELFPLLHTWSLSVEEQFYLFFPLFLLFFLRSGRRVAVWAVFSLLIASLALAQWAVSFFPVPSYFSLPTRGWELAIGAVAALVSLKKMDYVRGRTREALAFLGLASILASVFFFDKNTPFPSTYALLPTIGAVLIILFAHAETIVGRWLGSKILVGVGLISYSAYLWHQPLFAFARIHSNREPPAAVFSLLIAATMVLAYISWRFVEQPTRKAKWNRATLFSGVAAGSLFFIFVGAAGHFTHGFSGWKLTREQASILNTASPSPKRAECHSGERHQIAPKDACEYFSGAATWATFGDSHSVELAFALAKKLEMRDISLKHFSFSGCKPSFGVAASQEPCSEWTKQAIDYIVKSREITTVVVSYRINAWLFGEHEGVYPLLPSAVGESQRMARWLSYVELVRVLAASGKKVFLVLQAPELPRPVEALVFKAVGEANVTGVSMDWWEKRTRFLREHLKDIPNTVTVVDPSKLFCERETCYAVRNGVSLYFDDDHMSVAGAELVAGKIVEAFFNEHKVSATKL